MGTFAAVVAVTMTTLWKPQNIFPKVIHLLSDARVVVRRVGGVCFRNALYAEFCIHNLENPLVIVGCSYMSHL